MCTDWRTYPFLYPLLVRYFTLRNLIIWRHGMMKAGNWYRGSHELIVFATNGDSQRTFGGGQRDIWEIDTGIAYTKRLHPAQKPIELFQRMIENSSVEGDTVLDSFVGSGTSAVACQRLNRNFIGYEISEEYFSVAQQRLAEASAQKAQELF